MNWFTVSPVAPHTWYISEPIGKVEPRFGVETANMFLVAGRERAALVDTGMGIGDLRSAVAAQSRLPVIVCNTHWHWDHTGSNSAFDEIAIHEREFPLLTREQDVGGIRAQMARPEIQAILPEGFDSAAYRIMPKPATHSLSDGEKIDLGGRSLLVIHTPGHSAGHVAYFDDSTGMLFSGDTVYCGPMYACFKGGDPEAFHASARLLATMAEQVRLILPGHNQVLSGGSFLRDVAEAADQALEGTVPSQPPDDFIGGREVRFGQFSIWLPKESGNS